MNRTSFPPPEHLGFLEIENFFSGHFELNCLEMVLTKYTGTGEFAVTGPGIIRLMAGECFHITLFTHENMEIGDDISELFRSIGRIMPDTRYFNLSAKDTSGRLWKCEKILVSFQRDSSTSGYICTASTKELHYSRTIEEPSNEDYLTLFVPGQIAPELGVSIRSHETEGVLVEVSSKSKYFILSAKALPQILSKHAEIHFQEAFQFTCSHPFEWSVMLKRVNQIVSTTIRTNKPQKVTINPPIIFNTWEAEQSFWVIFSLYLRFVRFEKDKKIHPISVRLRAVYNSSSYPLGTMALVLSTVVESLLKEAFPDYGEPVKETKAEIDLLIKYLENLEAVPPSINAGDNAIQKKNNKRLHMGDITISADLRDRTIGSLRSMKNSRALDKLIALRKANVIDSQDIKNWQTLRNKSSHDFLASVHDFQEYLDTYHSVLVLMHKIVFYVIGYRGPYTDYSTRGFPTKIFSPKEVDDTQ